MTDSKVKADFIALALVSSKKLTLDFDSVSVIPKEDLAKLLAVN
jgi:hypothetical protein